MHPALKILLGTNALVIVAGEMFGPIYAFFVEKVGGDILAAGITAAAFPIVAGLMTIILGRLEDALKEQELMISWGYFVMAAGFLSFIFVGSPAGLFLAQAVIGPGYAIYAPAWDALYSKYVDHKRGAFLWGTQEGLQQIFAAVGAISGGVIATYWGFNPLFMIMAALAFLSGLYVLLLPRSVL